MITRLTLSDFKAFHALDLELRPITLFLGENNSGKSSILAALRLLAQTMTSFGAAVPLLLQGEFGDFGTFRDIVHGNHRGRPFRISVESTDFDADAYVGRVSVEFKYRTVRRELILREAIVTQGNPAQHLITVSHSKDAERLLITRLAGRFVRPAVRARLADWLRVYHFLPELLPYRRRGTADREFLDGFFDAERGHALMSDIDVAAWAVRDDLLALDYLGPMRVSPERFYTQTGELRNRIGATGQHWVSILIRELVQTARSGKPTRMIADIQEWLNAAGLAGDLAPEWASDRYFELRLQHPVTGEYENLADVGQASSQVLPVLVGGLRLPPGSMYLVEEPEIHLHPRAQAELGELFVKLHQRGIWSLVETHSEYLLLRLQQHVADGSLDPNEIVFYYVLAEGDRKIVKALNLDDRGRFVEPLPGGFFPERLEEAKNLARLRGRKMIKDNRT